MHDSFHSIPSIRLQQERNPQPCAVVMSSAVEASKPCWWWMKSTVLLVNLVDNRDNEYGFDVDDVPARYLRIYTDSFTIYLRTDIEPPWVRT